MSRVQSMRAWGPSTGPTACALAGRRCSLRHWRKGVPGGGAFHHCEGCLSSGAVPPPTARPLDGVLGSATHVLWARVCGCRGSTLSPWPACPVGAACRGGGGEPSPGGLACHACEGRLVSGAVPPPAARPPERAARLPRPVCPGCGRCGCGDPAPAPQRAPLRAGVARCGGGGRASRGGGAFHHCEGRLSSGAVPPPTARPLGGLFGSATHVLSARVCECGGPTLSPLPACPVGAACRRRGGGPSPGGVACHRCEGRLVSGSVPLPAARPLEQAARVLRPVCPGCGRCGHGDPAPATQPAPLRAGVACCGGGGRASPGGVPSAVVRGALGQALPLPRLPALWAGCRGSLATGCGCWGCGRGDPSPTPQRALLRAVGTALGRPGGAPLAWVWGVRDRALSHPRPVVLLGCGRGPLPTGCGCGGVRACRPVTNPTARTLASWLCALWGRHEGARGGRLLSGCEASGVGRSPTPDHPSFRACGRGPLPTGRGCGVLAWGPGCLWHLVPCRGSSCVVRASRVRGTWWPLWLSTSPRAVILAGGVPLWRALWPRVGAPLLVQSSRSRCSGRLSRRCGATPHPGGCRPQLYWVAARGTWRQAGNRAHCACRWPLPRQGRWARSASYPFGAPPWCCPWRVPPASVLGCVRCGGLACVDPVTDASGFPNRPSCDGGLGRCTGAVSCGRLGLVHQYPVA